jgi:serine O-acetyltransferase
MTFPELQRLIQADPCPYDGAQGTGGFARAFFGEPGFQLTVLLRAQPLTRWGCYHLCKLWLGRLSRSLGVFVDFTTDIGPGLYLPHPVGIVINRRCRIGANCNIAQHVTLGLKSREPREGFPTLGDRVYVGPEAVVAGVPATVISMRGSVGYINHCAPYAS